MISRATSLTHRVSRLGEARCWLTKESGSLPESTGDGCTRCAFRQHAGDTRQAYMVIVADHPGERVWTEPPRRVAFAQLDARTITVAFAYIAPIMLGKGSAERLPALRTLFVLFRKGLFSSSIDCECGIHRGVCAPCEMQQQPRFVWENGFSRLYPFGRGHWYRGVSDAVDYGPNEHRWLQCCKIA